MWTRVRVIHTTIQHLYKPTNHCYGGERIHTPLRRSAEEVVCRYNIMFGSCRYILFFIERDICTLSRNYTIHKTSRHTVQNTPFGDIFGVYASHSYVDSESPSDSSIWNPRFSPGGPGDGGAFSGGAGRPEFGAGRPGGLECAMGSTRCLAATVSSLCRARYAVHSSGLY